MSYARMQQEERRLEQEIANLCEQAQTIDTREDGLYGADHRGDELPEELRHRQPRLEKIRAAKARLEAAQRAADKERGRHEDDDRKPPGYRGPRFKRDFGVPEDKAQSNFTDPESRIMKTGDGYQQCYNGQLAVDDAFQLIVANRLTANASDNGELLRLLERIETILQGKPERLLADAGYRKEADLKELETRGINACVSLGKEGKEVDKIDAGKHPATSRMAQKLATAEGRESYAQRKHIVEAVNGWIKNVLGFRQFSLRGEAAVSGEWELVCLATNLRRMRPLITFG
jgi:hypothetical protein